MIPKLTPHGVRFTSRPSGSLNALSRTLYRRARLLTPSLRYLSLFRRRKDQEYGPSVRIHRPHIFAPKSVGQAIRVWLVVAFVLYLVSARSDEEEDLKGAKGVPNPRANTVPDQEGAEEAEDEGEEDEVELPEELPENAIFLPLWYPSPRPDYYFKGSDPEWQAYVELARDQQKLQRGRSQVVDELVKFVGHQQKLQQFLGPPAKPRRVWLDYSYPDKAPKEFERVGIEIADNYVALTRRPMSERDKVRLDNALIPKGMLSALWQSYRFFWALQYARVKEYMNVRSDFGGPQDGKLPQPGPFNLGGGQKAQRSSNSGSGHSSLSGFGGLGDAASALNAPEKSSTPENHNKDDTAATRKDQSKLLSSLPVAPQLTQDLAGAMATFRFSLAASSARSLAPIERGNVVLAGMVELEGKNACLLFDVMAFYDPKLSRISTMGTKVRATRTKKIFPKGGP